MDVILIDGLTKSFPSGWPGLPPVTALDGLSLSVHRGEIYGFLGPNGSGKTTTLKILMGLVRSTSGKAEVLGKPAGDVQARRQIGFLPEGPYFYDYLTAEEFLAFYGRLAGLERAELGRRIDHMLEVVGLNEARTRQLRKFSKGMLQRIGLAQALIHDPELVILDEPMSGLDPIGRKQVRDLILGLRDQGKTVFFSTHIIPDVEMICDRVGIVMKGRVMAAGRVDELVRHEHTQSVEIVCEGIKVDELPAIKAAATRVLQRGQQCLVALPGPDRQEEILAEIRAHGGRLVSVTPQKGSLEELFFAQESPRTGSQADHGA
ncbi:MAG: ABC transporter ATP-binding protein [Nitrospirae bacterium]|nr:MAG: ABC transporter ATP-binding protein [Nitrospirota bacterium]